MNKELALGLLNEWNGEDTYFLYDGAIYTEDDVHHAEEYLEQLKQK